MRKPLRNLGASVRARLLTLAKTRNEPFDLLLTRYVIERFLYRLSVSKHRDRFVLKGAMLIATWFDDPHRPTRDVDLLGFGEPDPALILAAFSDICAVPAEDAVTFDIKNLAADRVRDEAEYQGLRVKTNALVDGARVRLVVDIGFGDAVEAGFDSIEMPVLLDLPPPRLRAYPREAVIAEKFHAMVILGLANSRMKDLYDVWLLTQSHEFKSDRLSKAIAATFARRNTAIPTEPPDSLTHTFATDPSKMRQWVAFIEDVAVKPGSLASVVDDLVTFLMPYASEAHKIRDD